MRPDNRPAPVVWHFFKQEFERCPNFPSVSWALGSDWGMGLNHMTADQYREKAFQRMTAIYGPEPK